MNEALDFILESTLNRKGSEIFVPKLRTYSIKDLKKTLMELIGNTGEREDFCIKVGWQRKNL